MHSIPAFHVVDGVLSMASPVPSRLEVHLFEEVFHLLCLFIIDLLHLIQRHQLCVEARIEDGVAPEDQLNSRFERKLIQTEVSQECCHGELDDTGSLVIREDEDLIRWPLDFMIGKQVLQ